MDFSSNSSWFSQLGNRNPFFCDQNDFFVSAEKFPNALPATTPPVKLPKPDNHFGNFTGDGSAPVVLNFGNATFQSPEVLRYQNSKEKKKKVRVRRPSQVQHHIVTERKRREQLNQLFIALSAMVPGLKRVDKNSVLRDTIKYFQHLHNRVTTLEKQKEEQNTKPMVVVSKSQFMIEDDDGFCIPKNSMSSSHEQLLPEIEAKIWNNRIILKIYCEKRKGVLIELIGHVEKFNLAVANTNVALFGSLALHITIIAEMEKEFNSTAENVVAGLRSSMLQCLKYKYS